ncbi:MAG: three-Cys-motif partner protein TcmP [Cellvibrionales bacterium]|nr:three-Cys-motif partner protein TcmP [Cellvibrionales bacterium]
MVKKSYDWNAGADLDNHTKKKHQILSAYFAQYLRVRCAHPQQSLFRLAIVDGFSGSGLYKNGEYGSPLIFIDTLHKLTKEINCKRAAAGLKLVNIECLIIFNDIEKIAIEKLKENIAPLLAGIQETEKNLSIRCKYFNDRFEDAYYTSLKQEILATNCKNVFFNLDQCGYSHVTAQVISEIMTTWKSAEVLLTFMIESLLAFLSPNNNSANKTSLEPEAQEKINMLLNGRILNKRQWLGEAEKIVFQHLQRCAKYVSPFSINNPDGWQYWLMHFATSYRARQVYNDVLHRYGEAQAHYGRAGLNMLSFDPAHKSSSLYLFDDDSRLISKDALHEDIPRLISQAGDAILVGQFYENAYSETPAHSEDIHQVIIENPDLEVITDSGGERRKANTIRVEDIIRVKNQRSFFPMFLNDDENE